MKTLYKTLDGNKKLELYGDGLLYDESTGHSYEQRLCKVLKVHLKSFGINKATLWKNFKEEELILLDLAQGEDLKERELLERKTQYYTLEEMKILIGLMTTSHDECVDGTPENHWHRLEVYQAKKKFERKIRAEEKLNKL